MPENANIFLFDPDKENLTESARILEQGGHRIIESASTLQDADTIIPHLGQKIINIAVVTERLNKQQRTPDTDNIAFQIRLQHPDIIVVGYVEEDIISSANICSPISEGLYKLTEVVRRE